MGEHVAVVIPAYNEARTIEGVIRGLMARGLLCIIVVDDGSIDRTGELAGQQGAQVVRHILNRGLGGALGTGLRAALRLKPEIIVTCDADGQHDPDDIRQLLGPIEQGEADVVIGSRMLNPAGMPWSRRLANWVANLATYFLFGVRTTDSQSGLRAFSRDAAEQIRIMSNGMEVSSEIIVEIVRSGLRLKEVPVRPIYTQYSLSKGQSLNVGLHTLTKLLLARIRRRVL
jgi:glycosyltransferase involved in cell wall biosynthesis